MKRYLVFAILIYFVGFAFQSCSKDSGYVDPPEPESPNPDPDPESNPDPDPVILVENIPAHVQRSGDAQVGYEYLISGEYMSSGIPYDAYILGFGEDNSNLLNRTGDNAVIIYDKTAVNAPNGTRVVAPNCLACHASTINNEFVIGLGSHDGNFTFNRADNINLLNSVISSMYGGEDSNEFKDYDQFRKSIIAIGPKTITETRGVNPADKIAQVLIAQRDKSTLEWLDEPNVLIDDVVIPTDVPAWWLLKKKNAMFYHAMGRKDFVKSFIGSSLLTLADVSKAEELDEKMVDVLAYIEGLEAPAYPFDIDTDLAASGKSVFEANCVKCHGTYENSPTYPNLLVALATIGTDSELSNHYSEPSVVNDYFLDWFNTGWFGTSDNPLQVAAAGGYIAPPLDGIWATAPYLHNASVPTLDDLLNSSQRPTYWSRSYNSTDYDTVKVGWLYTVENGKDNANTYDTTLKGYGNGGHTFGDNLSTSDRGALIAYLKTL